MLLKLFYFMIAVVLGFYLGDVLTAIFWFLPIREIADMLWPWNIFKYGPGFYLSFIVWTLVFWSMLRTLGITFFVAKTQGLGNTSFRRVHGVLVEAALLAMFAAPVVLTLMTLGVSDTPTPAAAFQSDRPWRTLFGAIGELWLYAFGPAAWLYWLLRRPFRRFVSRHVFGHVARFLQEIDMGLGGSSKMGGAMDEWDHIRHSQELGHSLFVGRSLYNPNDVIVLEDGGAGVVTYASSRAGKNASVIIPNSLTWKHSLINVDPKGTTAAVTASRRREMGQEVLIYAPFAVPGITESDCYNPLASLDPTSDTLRADINVIVGSMVIMEPEAAEQKHWDEGARTVVGGYIDHLVTSDEYSNPTLPMLRDLLALSGDEQDTLWAKMSLSNSPAGLARDAANRIRKASATEEIAGILSNADKHTQWLSDSSIRRVLSGNDENPFANAKNTPTSIYVVLPPHLLDTEYKRFVRLFINLAIMQAPKGGRARVPNLLIIDEFLALDFLPEVQKAFALLSGYNLICWIFVQEYGGLRKLYGAGANAFNANVRAIQGFGIPVTDLETTRFFSDVLGERRLKESRNGYRDRVPLRTPQEVATDIDAKSMRQYIIRPGRPAILAERVEYYTPAGQRLFGRFDPDPDYVRHAPDAVLSNAFGVYS